MVVNGPSLWSSRLIHCLLIGLLLAGSRHAQTIAATGESVAKTESRPGVSQSYLLIEPERQPRAIAVLFVGGEGELGLEKGRLTRGINNFLMRTRQHFAGNGLLLAYPDTPSDQRNGLGNFRTSPQHAEDIAAVVKAMTAAYPGLPVFLIGTSRGTLSAVNGAARLPPGTISGLVLSSTVTVRGNKGQASVNDLPLKDITTPVFNLAHMHDGCYVTPPSRIPAMFQAMSAAPRQDSRVLEGGSSAGGDACGAQSAHGFLGIEEQAVKAMTDWIDSLLASR